MPCHDVQIHLHHLFYLYKQWWLCIIIFTLSCTISPCNHNESPRFCFLSLLQERNLSFIACTPLPPHPLSPWTTYSGGWHSRRIAKSALNEGVLFPGLKEKCTVGLSVLPPYRYLVAAFLHPPLLHLKTLSLDHLSSLHVPNPSCGSWSCHSSCSWISSQHAFIPPSPFPLPIQFHDPNILFTYHSSWNLQKRLQVRLANIYTYPAFGDAHLISITPEVVLGSQILVRILWSFLQRRHVRPMSPMFIPQDVGIDTGDN